MEWTASLDRQVLVLFRNEPTTSNPDWSRFKLKSALFQPEKITGRRARRLGVAARERLERWLGGWRGCGPTWSAKMY